MTRYYEFRFSKMLFINFILSLPLIIIWISPSDALIEYNEPSKERTMKSLKDYKPTSVEGACTNQTIMGIVTFRTPFNGLLYAKGHPNYPCIAEGNGTNQIRLALPTNECGTTQITRTDGKQEFQVFLYLQHDKKLLKFYDEVFNLRCAPSDISIIMSLVNHKNQSRSKTPRKDISLHPHLLNVSSDAKQYISESDLPETSDFKSTNMSSSTISRQISLNRPELEPIKITIMVAVAKSYDGLPQNFSSSEENSTTKIADESQLVPNDPFPANESNPVYPPQVKAHMLKGITDPLMKIFFIQNSEKYAENILYSRNVETVTVKIQLKHSKSFYGKIYSCYVYDEQGVLLNLTNSNGDSFDETVMPNFSESYDEATLTKTAVSKFSIIEFPHSQGINVNCSYKIDWDTYFNSSPSVLYETIRPDNQTDIVINAIKKSSELKENQFFSYVLQNSSRNISDDGKKVLNLTEQEVFKKNYFFQFRKPSSSSDDNHRAEFLNSTFELGLGKCLTSYKVIALISFLLSFLIVSLVVTICMCVKSREMRRRLMARSNYFMKTAQYHP